MDRKNVVWKILAGISWIFSGALLLACWDYYIGAPFLSIFETLSILVPWLVVGNLILAGFLLALKKRTFLLPILSLFVAFVSFGSIYELGSEQHMNPVEDLRVMTFNTRSFSDRRYVSRSDTENKISSFVKGEDPDIL
ncbi:MAG: hypothetical protein P8Z38_13365, partial [Robiginitalea sp.]